MADETQVQDAAQQEEKTPEVGITFMMPPVWLGYHWHTYQKGQADYRALVKKDPTLVVDGLSLEYQGVRALVNAGHVRISMSAPLAEDATEAEKSAYKGVELMLQAIQELMLKDVKSHAPLSIQAALAGVVAAAIEAEVARPLGDYLKASSNISAIVTLTSNRKD